MSFCCLCSPFSHSHYTFSSSNWTFDTQQYYEQNTPEGKKKKIIIISVRTAHFSLVCFFSLASLPFSLSDIICFGFICFCSTGSVLSKHKISEQVYFKLFVCTHIPIVQSGAAKSMEIVSSLFLLYFLFLCVEPSIFVFGIPFTTEASVCFPFSHWILHSFNKTKNVF